MDEYIGLILFSLIVGLVIGWVSKQMGKNKKDAVDTYRHEPREPSRTSVTRPVTNALPSRSIPPVTQAGGGGAYNRPVREQPVAAPARVATRQVVTISVPRTTGWNAEHAVRLMDLFFALHKPMHLVIRASYGSIVWSVEVGRETVSAVTNALYSLYPSAGIETSPKQEIDLGYTMFAHESATPFTNACSSAREFSRGMSPLSALASNLEQLQEHDHFVYEVVLSPSDFNYKEMAQKFLYWSTGDPVYKDAIHKRIEEKIHAPLMDVQVVTKFRVLAKDHTGDRRAILSQVNQSVTMALAGNVNADNWFYLVDASAESYPLVMTAAEVATLWHVPTSDCQAAGIVWSKAATAPLPVPLLTKNSAADSVVLGTHTYHGNRRPVRLDYSDRITHVNLIGRTRVGKSTLMHNMAHHDIAAGHGVAVIDPHGDLVNDVLACSIPPEREQDVVLFDVTDTDYPIGLNLLTVPDGVPPEVGASQALDVVRKMFADEWHAGRMENVLYACLIALVTYKGATIQDVAKMPINADFRNQVLQGVTDVTALEYWYDIHEALRPGAQLEIAQPIINRIQRFYREPTMRRIVCQKESLDFRSILDNRKIFLANLGGLSSIESETLGALLISKIQMAAMGRVHLSPAKRTPFYCFIDEVQNFVTTSLGKVFSEAAKYGLSLVVANQFLSQLTGDTLDTIVGNVGTTLMFRCGHDDARLLGRFAQPQFDAEALLNLDRFVTVVKMQQGGETMPAFSVVTPPPLKPTLDAGERVHRIREASRHRYARPRAEVDAELAKQYTGRVTTQQQEPSSASDTEPDGSFLG